MLTALAWRLGDGEHSLYHVQRSLSEKKSIVDPEIIFFDGVLAAGKPINSLQEAITIL